MMLSGLAQHAHKVGYLLKDHSTTLLTVAGVGGTIGTALLTGRATFKAADVIAKEQHDLEEELKFPETEVKLSKTEKTKLVWHLYLPPVASGVLTVTCIIVAHRISTKQIVALTAAAGISERALQEYKDKVLEKFGAKDNEKIRDDIAQDRVNKHPVDSREIILAGTGEVLCYDMTTGRYFQSTVEEIKRAENKINSELLQHMSASLAEFHDEIGLPATSYTDSVGWGSPEIFKVVFSTVMSTDGRPCIAIDFERPPTPEYSRMHG
jgi:Family of unknown function (DUF6353)